MTSILFAHPGHGTTSGNSLVHYFSEPTHVAFLVAGVALVVCVNWYVQRTQTHREAQQPRVAKS